MKRAYVFLNGELRFSKNTLQEILEEMPGEIFCVDGGSRHLKELNILPLELWGDLDSTPLSLRQEWEKLGCQIHQFPIEKDFTDFELLLHSLEKRNYEEIFIIAGLGGDSDHFLANINLCFRFPKIEFLSEEEHIFLAPKQYVFHKQEGHKVSFVPMSEKVTQLSLQGFQYDLENRTLARYESLCHGNQILASEASLKFKEGALLVVLKKQLKTSNSN